MINLLNRIRRDETAATAVEYGLILSLIVLAMITALQGVATETIGMWSNVSNKYAESAASARN